MRLEKVFETFMCFWRKVFESLMCDWTKFLKLLCAIGEARAGLGPSPGWGPVRVGAHMGKFLKPLCAIEESF